MSEVLTAVSTVGFPIVACVALFKVVFDQTKTLTTLKDSIDNNTSMLKAIISKLDSKQ